MGSLHTSHTLVKTVTLQRPSTSQIHTDPLAQRRPLTSVLYPQTTAHRHSPRKPLARFDRTRSPHKRQSWHGDARPMSPTSCRVGSSGGEKEKYDEWTPEWGVSTHANNKSSRARDCGRGPVSVGAFFFLLSSIFSLLSSLFFLLSSIFFSHPKSCLKIKIFVGRSDVSGRERGAPGRENWKKSKMAKLQKWKKRSPQKVKEWKMVNKWKNDTTEKWTKRKGTPHSLGATVSFLLSKPRHIIFKYVINGRSTSF